MNKRYGIVLFSLMIMALLTTSAFAEIELGKDGLLEKAEPAFEIINLLVAIVIIVLAVSVLPRLAGPLKRAWIFLTIAVSVFGLFELLGVLKEFNVFRWHGLGDLLEFLFIIALFVTVYGLQKHFKQIGK